MITVSNVTSGSSSSTSGTTASITTVTGQMYMAAIFSSSGGTQSINNGLGLTWTSAGSATGSTGSTQGTMFYAVCSAGSTGTLAVTIGASSGGGWNIDTIIGQSASTPYINTTSNSGGGVSGSGSGSITINMSSYSNPNNLTYLMSWDQSVGGTLSLSLSSGFTQTYLNNSLPAGVSYVNGMMVQYMIGATSFSVGYAVTSGSAAAVTGLAVQIGAPPPAANTQVGNSLMLFGSGI